MTLLQFLLALVITFVTLVLVRALWKTILMIGMLLYILGHLIFWSFILMLIWVGFISQTAEGFGWLWLYFFLTLAGIVLVYAIIILDIYDIAIDWIRSILKIK